MDKRLLDILCCPATRLPLRLLSEAELEAINHAIGEARVCNDAGAAVTVRLPAGLITRDSRRVYRIEDDIPVMLADEAIATAQIEEFPLP